MSKDEIVDWGYDQIIVGRNKTRHEINQCALFKQTDIDYNSSPLPIGGEKIICLKNHRKLGLVNGAIGIAGKAFQISDNVCSMDFHTNYRSWGNLHCDSNIFLNDGYRPTYKQEIQQFDYAYALTCHKAQGSEFNSVAIVREAFGDEIERRRWIYTAITRAKEKCMMVDRIE